MAKTLLVSLISDQTIPNVQLIKEFNHTVTDYLFVSTEGMEKKNTRKWIENACCISDEQRSIIIVEEFSVKDIEEKLKVFDFKPFERILVNLTGGTKTMTLVANEFFKSIANEIYYVTGQENEYVRLSPKSPNGVLNFSEHISLREYLTAYGFSVAESEPSGVSFGQTCQIFNNFINLNMEAFRDELKFMSAQRGKQKGVKEGDYDKIKRFVDAVSYHPSSNALTYKEVKYLTGEWFEEYVGFMLKHELNIPDHNILIGATLSKETPLKTKNSVYDLLNNDDLISGSDSTNEMDVMFIHKGVFYSVECKSSIVAYKIVERNNDFISKPYNILGETIYKSDSLKSRFGLYPKTTIVTLTSFVDYSSSTDKNIHGNRIKDMESLINRANLSNIKLIDKNMLLSSNSLFNLLK